VGLTGITFGNPWLALGGIVAVAVIVVAARLTKRGGP
jgi:hypothetical protein